MVTGAQHKFKLVGLDSNGLEEGRDDLPVVFSPGVDELDRGLQVVQEGVNIGEKDDDLAVSS